MACTVFTIANQKGGVGKTTTAVNLAAALAERKIHTLLVDLDPQANATSALGIEKQEGDLRGWIGYTLALVKRGDFVPIDDTKVFAGEGKYFFPRYDRRNDLSVVLMYDLGKRWNISGTVIYGSGDRTWLPVGRFAFQDVYGADFQPVTPIYGERNAFRLPYFVRTDLGITYKMFPQWGESDLTLSFFNLTNRRNAFFLYIEPKYAEGVDPLETPLAIPTGLAAKQVSLFPIIGSLTWNFKF